MNSQGMYSIQKRSSDEIIHCLLSKEVVQELVSLLKNIQIETIQETWMLSICDDTNHTFTFTSASREVYKYSTMFVNWQLKPVQEFLLQLNK